MYGVLINTYELFSADVKGDTVDDNFKRIPLNEKYEH